MPDLNLGISLGKGVRGRMKLQHICNGFFDPQRKRQGKDYFDIGKVLSVPGMSEGFTSFIVNGSDVYECCIKIDKKSRHDRLTLSDTIIAMSCMCLDFEEGNYCKHIWASILMGDSTNLWGPFKCSKKPIVLRLGDHENTITEEADFYSDSLDVNKFKEVGPSSNIESKAVRKETLGSSSKTKTTPTAKKWMNAFKSMKRKNTCFPRRF